MELPNDHATDPILATQAIAVRVRVYAKARNFRLRIASNGEPVLSVPARGNIKDAKEFLNRQKGWLIKRLDERPKPVVFIEGAQFPVRAQIYQIFGTGKSRGQVEVLTHEQGILLETPKLVVPGGEKHIARRLKDWLKKEAYGDLEKASQQHAKTLGVSFSSISIKGQSSRWGSCSSAGRINYNWRLIMAPDFVLDYVAAHEVAHLCEMNHSKAFWDTVLQTLPDMERGRDWLKANGNQLMAYGAEIK
ncbi:MAG: M48 family metallopeptidase [Devosiaceae bacterium]|nr:M48 family metallopeptidase [Devosiaceae bacterium]